VITTPVRVSPDCALLPDGRAAYVVYLGKKGRAFRVSAHVGQWLLRGASQEDPSVSDADKGKLLELEVLAAGRTGTPLTINLFAPIGGAGWVLLCLLLLVGGVSWATTASAIKQVVGPIAITMHNWTTWIFVPFAAVFITLLHEWGHVLVLRALGGKAGRMRLRFGWPWALTEVGPFRDVMSGWQQVLLLSGGMFVEFVLLGLVLLYSKAVGAGPGVSAVAVTITIYLGFNLFPTPWSDGGQLVLLGLRCVLSLGGRRARHD
jgi:hypothetical protein